LVTEMVIANNILSPAWERIKVRGNLEDLCGFTLTPASPIKGEGKADYHWKISSLSKLAAAPWAAMIPASRI